MTESKRLVDLVQATIDDFLSERRASLEAVATDLAPFVDFSQSLLSGGKRFRALFCYWGWGAVVSGAHPSSADLSAVVAAASALELFHAAALVHDDIIDNSDTRRGMPAAHRSFETLHRQSGWSGDAGAFGRAGAILLGDLLLGWSDELLDNGLERMGDPQAARLARREFNRMRTDVTGGQYLDILEEHSWRSRDESELLKRAQRVIVHKTAKYSIESPLAIGGSLGGATKEQLRGLRGFGLPLGVAFQLRDDLLGVFGDPAQTGKPSGDDLTEGKRTVLVALARRSLPPSAARLLDELLGDPELTPHQISTLQASIRESGAVDTVERMIQQSVEQALDVLEGAPIDEEARTQLTLLADRVSKRVA